MSTFLLILGRNPELSRAELASRCDELLFDGEKSLMVVDNLEFKNPREIPREPRQLFLDNLGGLVCMAEVSEEFFDLKKLQQSLEAQMQASEKRKLGFIVYGGGQTLLSKLIESHKQTDSDLRIENHQGKNLSSGQIFERRLLQKAEIFVVWKKDQSYLLAKLVANQNLRNYKLRDRDKGFRDAHLGMLPPKLAQILINLNRAEFDTTIYDPFCGSGTINIEAGIAGYPTLGSDLKDELVQASEANFSQMSEKFRYSISSGKFFPSDATKIKWGQIKSEKIAIATEGYLGKNFAKNPTSAEIEDNARVVIRIWQKFFQNLPKTRVESISLCLPAWQMRNRERRHIFKEFIQTTQKSGWKPQPVFAGKTSFVYERENTFVAREIVVLRRG